MGFSPDTVAVLRNADRKLRSAERGDAARRYAVVKAALMGLAPMDAFYIGYFKGERSIIITYIYDGDQRLAPEVLSYAPGGVSDWIRSSRKPYLSREDNGRRLHRGAPMGDSSQLTQDAVVVPLIDVDSGDALGMMSAQSLRADTFSDEFVRATEWLARALVQSMNRDAADAETLGLYELYPELNSSRLRNESDLLNRIGDRLYHLHRVLADLRDQALAVGGTGLVASAETARDLCERMQDEVADLVRAYEPPIVQVDLTEREREVATLIAHGGLSNAALASRLHISEKTVKTHVGNVLRKLGITQRSAIAWTLPSEGSWS